VKAAVSIVISGFGARNAPGELLRNCLKAVALQVSAGPVEVILVETAELNGQVLENTQDPFSMPRVVPCLTDDPWARKTEGARNATAPIVAFLDADCIPLAGWLGTMMETFQYYPEVAVVRGRDEEHGWFRRWIPSRRGAGPVGSTAANNVAFRREAYLDCPFPEGAGTEAVAFQSAALRRAHYVVWAQPAMQVIREPDGWERAAGTCVGYPTAASAR
jgi:hypothetical protein